MVEAVTGVKSPRGSGLRSEDLRFFEAIVRNGGLHAATGELGVSQPALTKAVQRLEKRFGVKLLERSPMGMSPTQYGRALCERARQVQLLMEDSAHEIDDMLIGRLGLVRFGVIPSLAESTSALFLAMAQARPLVKFQISVQLSTSLMAQLRAGQLDLILAATPTSPPEDVTQVLLRSQLHHVVARAGHPLLAHTPLKLEQLQQQKWLLPQQFVTTRAWIDSLFEAHGLAVPRVQLEIDNSSALFATLVRSSDYLTAMSEDLLNSSVGNGLQALSVHGVEWRHPLYLAWRRSGYLSPIVRDFRDLLSAQLST